jgi:adenosine deaminase
VRDSTVLELMKQNNISEEEYPLHEHRDLDKAFQCFRVLHQVLNKRDVLERVTREVLHDFHSDNVVYLELRTTPRNIFVNQGQIVLTKKDHIDLILGVIKEFEATTNRAMIVRLLLSVDRCRDVKENLETIELCHEHMNDTEKREYLVGIDFR